MSEEQPTIFAALNAVRMEIGAVGKDERNPQGGYDFRGIDAVVNAASPALIANGVLVIPQVTSYEYGEILVGRNRTPMGHAKVIVAYTFYGPTGDSIDASAPGEAFDSGDKATPKAMSVAFRTALVQALTLPTGSPDPDSQTYQRADHQAPPDVDQETGEVRMIDRGQLIELKTLESKLGKGGKDETDEAREDRMRFYTWATGRDLISSARELTQSEAEMVIAELRKRVPPEPES